jgi:hypothetical protein
MKLPIVTELTEPPVVGQFYLVPCVLYWWSGRRAWWPVIGPKHDDVEHLNFAQPHYHLDRRFLPERMFSDAASRIHPSQLRELHLRHPATTLAARPLGEYGPGTKHNPDSASGGPLPAPALRKKRCIIADVGFPALADEGVYTTFDRFHAAYEGKRCGRDAEGHLICPHKGARLSSLAADRNGVVTCPLHGLAINVRTGVVVKRARAGGSVTR